MENITFTPNTTAQQIYSTTLQKTASQDGKKLVDIMFHSATMMDGDHALSEEEAKKKHKRSKPV